MQPSSQYYHRPQQTVLVSNGENGISSDHPLFYVRQKNYFLEQLSNKVAVQSKFNQMDLKRNARVDHLMDRHAKINQQIQKEERKRKMYLSSQEFVPIVGISQQEKRRKREEKQGQKLREHLYKNFIQQSTIHQTPQKDTYCQSDFEQFQMVRQNQELKNFTVLSDYRSDPARRKELYLLDMEIGKLRQEQNLQKLVKKKQSQCSNNEFLSRISNTIMSSYMVYFDQIFNALMDQLLQEEVVYFNSLEAGFYLNQGEDSLYKNRNKNSQDVGQKQSYRKNPTINKDSHQLAADVRAIKMIELVRCLDDLAYD